MQEHLRLRGNLPEEGEAGSKEVSTVWRQGVTDRARRKRDVKNRHEERQIAAIRIQVHCLLYLSSKLHVVSRVSDSDRLAVVIRRLASEDFSPKLRMVTSLHGPAMNAILLLL